MRYASRILAPIARTTRRAFCQTTCRQVSATYDRIFLHESGSQGGEKAWSATLSFATPESDFVGFQNNRDIATTDQNRSGEWSNKLSFATPESDFVAFDHDNSTAQAVSVNGPSIDYSSLTVQPETAFGVVHQAEFLDASTKNDLLHSQGAAYKVAEDVGPIQEFSRVDDKTLLSFGMTLSPESAAGFIHAAEFLSSTAKEDLHTIETKIDELPKTLDEALHDPRAVVVTAASSPFDIVDVNDAWVGLCGFSRDEAVHQNLGALLQGPETSVREATDLISRLKRDHYSEALITNYTKSGRKFTNHVKVGVLSESDAEDAQKFFVGVLTELHDSERASASI